MTETTEMNPEKTDSDISDPDISGIDRQAIIEQIERYKLVQPRFEIFAEVLHDVLYQASKEYAPLGIVQSRAKKVASFAEKIQRKKGKYLNPVHEFTDLCGARVITHTYSEVEAVCRFIENNFIVDAENSVQISQRLKPTEFGYRSVHYVVQFKPGKFPTGEVQVQIPGELFQQDYDDVPMKAEIQVRTLLEHAWAVFSHERVYKGSFSVPESWERELAGISAMLEEADKSFIRIQDGLQRFGASYEDYLSPKEIRQEIALKRIIQECEPDDPALAHDIARLAISVGDWKQAVAALQPLVDKLDLSPKGSLSAKFQPLLRDLGMALCKASPKNAKDPDYARGQSYLMRASEIMPPDPDVYASLAGTYKAVNDAENERIYYRKAFQCDPSDPYAVEGCLTSEILYRKDLSPVQLMMPAIQDAMQRCRNQIEVGMNIPWAYYSLGLFHLLLYQPYESLVSYANAVQKSTHSWMVDVALKTVVRLEDVRSSISGYEWIHKSLVMSRAACFPNEETLTALKTLAPLKYKPIQTPVIILAGGTDELVESKISQYRQQVVNAFEDFEGTVISGGTRAGIVGFGGDIQQKYSNRVKTIGYLPRLIPSEVEKDSRYSEFRITTGDDFSALETVQYWIDLVSSGIKPEEVKLLGINGGTIASAEFRLALALGATVGVIAGSGRAADELLLDPFWGRLPNLIRLTDDCACHHAFIGAGKLDVGETLRLKIAQGIHAEYLTRRVDTLKLEDPAMRLWDELDEHYRQYNFEQADNIPAKLRAINLRMQPAEGKTPVIHQFTEEQIEILAEMEHTHWMVKRLLDGWQHGEVRDVEKRTSPYLVPWLSLPEDARDWDRGVVAIIPRMLAEIGYEVVSVE